MRATTLQQVIVEVWLYIHFFSILSDEFASFDREAKLPRVKELRLPAEEAIFQCQPASAVRILSRGRSRISCSFSAQYFFSGLFTFVDVDGQHENQ